MDDRKKQSKPRRAGTPLNPEGRGQYWQEMVRYFDALNARDGTEPVSKHMMKRRRRRARDRVEKNDESEHEWIAAIDAEETVSVATMQAEMDAAWLGKKPTGRGH